MQVFERVKIPELRPLIIYTLLIGSISYCMYQSAPQFGLQKLRGRISNATCIGNTAPFGCRLEVEYSHNNIIQQRTFVGSFNRKFDMFEEIDVWEDPADANNSTIQHGWSRDGIVLSVILLFLLFMYHTLRGIRL